MMFKSILILLTVCLPVSLAFAETLKVTLLGTGTPRPEMDRFGPAVLVEAGDKKLLFDAGRGVSMRLYQQNIPFTSINKIFFTHLHYDHVVGFADYWLTSWVWQRQEPLNIWGPSGTEFMLSSLTHAYQQDIHIRRDLSEKLSSEGIEFVVSEIEEGIIYLKGKLKVTAFRVDHKPVEHAFGYRIDFAGRSVVISGDTTYSKNLVKYSKDVDLLIHEIADAPEELIAENPRLKRVMAYHTRPRQMARIINETKPRQTVLTHVLLLGGSSEEQLTNDIQAFTKLPVIIGHDQMSFELGDIIKVNSAFIE